MRWTPRLRTVLFAVSLVILLLPLGGIVLMRLYESVLIRRTEGELAAQGAVVAAAWRAEVRRALDEGVGDPSSYGVRLAVPPPPPEGPEGPFAPIYPKLDLARDPILPDAPEARPPAGPPDPVALAAGRRIEPVLREAQRTTLAGIRIVDPGGTVVATTRSEAGLSLRDRDEVARALRGETVSLMRRRERDEPPPPLGSISRGKLLRVFVAVPVVENGRVWGAVVLSRTPMAVAESLYGIRWYVAAGAATLLLAALLVTALTSATIVRPVKELIRRTERLAAGDRSAAEPLSRPGTWEVRRLSEAFARTARALEERGDYITAFAAGVSHEFKTPLAGIRGAVEILRDHLGSMSAEERERFLAIVDEDAARLERLVGRLHELARAEAARPAGDSCEVREVLDEAARRHAAAGFEVRVEEGPGAGRAAVGAETLDCLVGNLLDNARRHAGPSASVTLRSRSAGRHVEVEVEDDGPGISEANAPRVFDRFFTTARGGGGSGLGLAIVKALAEAHGGSVSFESRPGRTVFRLRLPARPGPRGGSPMAQ